MGSFAAVSDPGHHAVVACAAIAIGIHLYRRVCHYLAWIDHCHAQYQTVGRQSVRPGDEHVKHQSSSRFFLSVDRSFFQTVCVLGYSLFPMVITAIATTFTNWIWVRLAASMISLLWCIYGKLFANEWLRKLPKWPIIALWVPFFF